ncbi:MAG: hypothetical protein AAGJ81_04615 [Verrucomicrobiota bacterium]
MSDKGEDWEDEELDDPSPSSRQRLEKGNILFGLARKEKVKRQGKKPLVQIRFYWKRVFVFLCVLAVMGWFVCGGALYYYFKHHRDYEEVSYWKMLILPLRLDGHRQEMGEFFIERGIEEIRDGNARTGFHHLRAGLARSPANIEARLLVARLFRDGLKDNRLAIEALQKGLRYGDRDPRFYEVGYLRPLLFLLQIEERDEERVQLADRLLGEIEDPGARGILQLDAALAESQLGRYDDAIRRLSRAQLLGNPSGLLLMGSIFENLGMSGRAGSIYSRGAELFPKSDKHAEHYFRFLSKEGMWEDLLSYSGFRGVLNPDSLSTAVYRLYALDGLGRDEEVEEAANSILSKFGSEEAVFRILQFASDAERPDLVIPTLDKAQRIGVLETQHVVVGCLVLCLSGQSGNALMLLDSLSEEEVAEYPLRVSGIKAMAHEAIGESDVSQLFLQEFLLSDGTDEAVFGTIGEGFLKLGLKDTGSTVLLRGLEVYPNSQKILELLLGLESEDPGSLDYFRHAQALMSGRIPRNELLRQVRNELVSDRFLFRPGREDLIARIDGVLKQELQAGSAVAVRAGAFDFNETIGLEPEREFMQLPR